MDQVRKSSRSTAKSVSRAAVLAAASGLAVLSGCAEMDSFIDPSVVGRWERTPTSVPILDRLSAIEDSSSEYGFSEPTVDDLVPEPAEYRVGPGDAVSVILYDDIDNRGIPSSYDRVVDIRGQIELPQLGVMIVGGRTIEQAKQVIAAALSKFVNEPLVSFQVIQQRQQVYYVTGFIDAPGPYFISKPDQRLLEVVASAGRWLENVNYIYVIRQIPLTDAVRGIVHPRPGDERSTPPSGAASDPAPTPATPPPENVIDIIDDLTKPKDAPKEPAPAEKPADAVPPKSAISPAVLGRPTGERRPQPPQTPPASDAPPVVDLVDTVKEQAGQPPAEASSWVFLNGQWVQVRRADGAAAGSKPAGNAADQLLAQRVVRIPTTPLLAGDPRYNIVIRPGDIVRFPAPVQGLVYVAGQVQRPGPYNIPEVGKLTLLRAIDAAGGLTPIGVAERVDLTRMVGDNRQATIRLDLRAIAEGTQPDITMKRDDRINIGTNFWSYPLAIFRNGLRMTYGFGFVVDKNFSDNIFDEGIYFDTASSAF